MEELQIDNILSEEEVSSLFDNIPDNNSSGEDNETKEKETTETVDPDALFEEESESVGSGDHQEQEDPDFEKETGASPSNSIYSSIAKDLKNDGVFLDLDDETIASIESSEDLYKVLEEQIQAKMDARSKRIDDALNSEIEMSTVQKYERALSYLDSIEDSVIEDEGEEGEKLRKTLIYQDFKNRGFSDERAKREMEKSFSAGTDVEDAKEALQSNKDYINSEYDTLVKEAKKEQEESRKRTQKEAEALKKSIFEDKKLFGEIEVDSKTRQKIYDNMSKASYKDPESGEMLTPIQKYEKENHAEFIKNLSIVYTLTDGFKNLDGLIKDRVKKEVKKGQRELEHAINNTTRNSDGTLKFTSGTSDKNSYSSKFTLNL